MLNRPATKLVMNIEDDLKEYEAIKKIRTNNPQEFMSNYQVNEIIKNIPFFQKDLTPSNHNSTPDMKEDFKFSKSDSSVHEFNIGAEKPKEFSLGNYEDVQMQDDCKPGEKANDYKMFSTPNNK